MSMEWTLLIIALIVGYYIYNSVKQNSPESKIERLENSAEEFYPAVVKEAEEDVKDVEKELASVNKVVTKDETISKELFTEIKKYKNDFSGFMAQHKGVDSMKLTKYFLAHPTSTTIHGKTSYVSKSGTEKSELTRRLGILETKLNVIKSFKNNYIRLKEKYKHDSGEKKLALAQDYFDYFYTRTEINNELKHLKHAIYDKEWSNRIYKTETKLEIKAEEIVKRFDKKFFSN